MSQDTIAFFGSDASELYKANAYRALVLPAGYVLHVRYQKKYIHPNVFQHLNELVNQAGIIFYVSGNDQNVAKDQRKVIAYSLREVVVEDYEENVLTGTIHFYLRLGAFVDAVPDGGSVPNTLPPHFFVSRLTVAIGPNAEWSQRVDAIKANFHLPFFFIESVSARGRAVAPAYSKYSKSSRYELVEESSYVLHVTLYDPYGARSGLAAENSSNDITLAVPPNYRIGAARETQRFALNTHSVSRQTVRAITRLVGVADPSQPLDPKLPDYRVQLDWRITRGCLKPYAFGLLSALAALGLGMAKLATDDLSKANFSWCNAVLGICSLIAIGLSAALFYLEFNKK